jgi:hypothetical protein
MKKHRVIVVAAVMVVLAGAVFASAQKAQSPRPQTIVIEPIDATHVRLRLEGRETWIVESPAFTIQTNADSVKLLAQRGNNRVTLPVTKRESLVETWELEIAPPTGRIGFSVTTQH